jgi:hypothetical protein
MYWCDEGEKEETLRQGVLDAIEKAAVTQAISSPVSEPIPKSNDAGDNPPHAIAKNRYEEIAARRVCVHTGTWWQGSP